MDGGFGFLIASVVVPQFDSLIKRTGRQFASVPSVPVNAINLGLVCSDGLQSMSTLSDIPDLEILVVRRSEDVGIDPVPFDLGGTCEPVTESHRWLFGRTAQIPAQYVAVNGTRRQNIRMMSRKVDVCDCTFVAMQDMLDG